MDNLKDLKDLLEYVTFLNIVKFIFCSGIVIEVVPLIKWNPISSLLKYIGKKLNKDIEDKLTKVEAKVDTVQRDLQDHKVETWRRTILDFADSLMLGKRKTKEQFDYVIKLHDEYERYIEERGIDNGQIELAYEYISKCYQERRYNNSFYTGK